MIRCRNLPKCLILFFSMVCDRTLPSPAEVTKSGEWIRSIQSHPVASTFVHFFLILSTLVISARNVSTSPHPQHTYSSTRTLEKVESETGTIPGSTECSSCTGATWAHRGQALEVGVQACILSHGQTVESCARWGDLPRDGALIGHVAGSTVSRCLSRLSEMLAREPRTAARYEGARARIPTSKA